MALYNSPSFSCGPLGKLIAPCGVASPLIVIFASMSDTRVDQDRPEHTSFILPCVSSEGYFKKLLHFSYFFNANFINLIY